MKSFQSLTPTCLAMLLACTAASAQTVYRCGSSYGQTACPDGVVVPADDPRTEAQRAAAVQAAMRDKALANDMETYRRKDEATALAHEKAAQSAKAAAERKKREEERARQARATKKPTAKRKAQPAQPGVFNAIVAPNAPVRKAKPVNP